MTLYKRVASLGALPLLVSVGASGALVCTRVEHAPGAVSLPSAPWLSSLCLLLTAASPSFFFFA